MISIASPIQLGLAFYELPYSVQDVAYAYRAGEDRQTLSGTRTVQAAIDPSTGSRMEVMFGGSVSDGDIAIFTTATLHINDLYQYASTPVQFGGEEVTFGGEQIVWGGDGTTELSTTQQGQVLFGGEEVLFGGEPVTFGGEGVLQLQSFVQYSNRQYKVVDISDWSQQVGVNVYRASRHITQDLV